MCSDEWFELESIEDLSIGDMYFVADTKEGAVIGLGEFDGEGISTEAEFIELDIEIPKELRFMLFEWPDFEPSRIYKQCTCADEIDGNQCSHCMEMRHGA